MSRFMAIHTLPYTEAQLKEAAKSMPKLPAGLKWKQSYCDFASHKFFCEWEASSKEAIEQYFKTVNMPFEAFYSVRMFDVAKKKVEL